MKPMRIGKPAPCMGCPDRTPECHGQCERYKAFQAERQAVLAQRIEQNERDAPTDSRTRCLNRALVRKARYGG